LATNVDGGRYLIERLEAKRSSTLIQLAAVVGAVCCVALAALLQEPINTQRKDLQLVMQSSLYQELPPKYAWVSAAGGTFRGIVADILWMRAEELKRDGKYYESHQLASWICTLQPRFAAVWSFQAWNMSYNISVGTHTPEERWQWVYNGIRLLRDEGIPNNERVAGLYHQLAWIWYHKVGHRMDDYHWYYKRQWAATMEVLLGKPPVDVTNAEAVNWFRPVAEAPHRLEDLIQKRPGVKALVKQLDDLGVDVRAGTSSQRVFHPLESTFFRKYTAYLQETKIRDLRASPPEMSEEAKRVFAFFDAAASDDLAALLAYLRSKVLREQYKMDPQYMLEMSDRFDTDEPLPFDWRTPWAISLYWAMYGSDQISKNRNLKQPEIISTDRLILFSLSDLVKMGRYAFQLNFQSPMESYLALMPDLRYVEPLHKKYLELGKKHADEDEDVGETAGEMLRAGHVNNLHDAIVSLYLAGREDEARKYYEYLAVNYKDLYTHKTQTQYLQDLDSFFQSQVRDMADRFDQSRALIYQMLANAYISLGSGDSSEFSGGVSNAALVYRLYQKKRLGETKGRQSLPPFTQMRAVALTNFVTNPGVPILLRSLAWQRELNEVKRRCYDLVADDLTETCARGGLDFAKVFSPPEGLEQWRKAHPKFEQPEDAARKKKTQSGE